MKECFKCKTEKPLSEFYKHPKMADGRVNKCKECNKKDVRENREDKADYYREYDKQRFKNDPRVKKRNRRYHDFWVKRFPTKMLASRMVNDAVRDGRLAKPSDCESCGLEPYRLHGHHDDYAFPLAVRWLCAICHKKWHKLNGEGANAS